MKLRTLIIDDEQFALDKLRNYVEMMPTLELVAACSGTTEAMSYICEGDIDVIFTDIDLPDVNGIKFVESLRNPPLIVFITAYREYAVDGFRLSAVDYLVKPYDLADFQRAVAKVCEVSRQNRQSNEGIDPNGAIFIKVETKFERVSFKDILYVKGYGEYLQVFVENRPQPLMTLSSFPEIGKKLSNNFVQIHRSYTVNMDKVTKVGKNTVTIGEDTSIPVSIKCRDNFLNYLNKHSIGKLYK